MVVYSKQANKLLINVIKVSRNDYQRIFTVKANNTNFILKHNLQPQQIFRFNSTSSNPVNNNTKQNGFFKNSIKYSLAVMVGSLIGVFTGYYLMFDEIKLIDSDENESTRLLSENLEKTFVAARLVENKHAKYYSTPKFALELHIYQYESCPYCSQIRAYLDYFGFSYHLTEVDSYSKEEITKFTKSRTLPILVVEDKINKKRWHLANATAILSALESLRNEKHINYALVLNQYLPVLKGNHVHNTMNPYKYHVSNSELNSIEWRKWINNQALPAFKLNSVSTLKDLFETLDFYAEKSDWKLRYSKLKYLYVYYTKAFRTYREYSTLSKQFEKNKSARDVLHRIINEWETGLKDKQFINGNEPNLADISMFGAMRAYEGCALFRESIAKHPQFRAWYERMESCVLKGLYHDKPIPFNFLQNINLDDEKPESTATSTQTSPVVVPPAIPAPATTSAASKVKDKTSTSHQKPKKSSTTESVLVKKDRLTQAETNIFRVLTVNYLVHVVVFTYAAWMGR